MGVGILMLMGLGFTVVALPIAILWIVFHGLAFVAGLLGALVGGLGAGIGGLLGGLGRGIGSLFVGLGVLVRGLLGGVTALVVHLFRFVRGMLGDGLRIVGGSLTAALLTPLLLFHVCLLRGRTARHFASAIEDELAAVALSAYRFAIGHPVRLLGLSALTEGFERRIPDVIARAPGTTGPAVPIGKGDTKAFPGYKVLGKLKAGGSGGRLYLALPLPAKLELFTRAGHADPGKVVIKSFALEDGSTLPQIVRESRALEAARELGYVLEHELSPHRFHYVMPFVDGDELSTVTRRLHDASGPAGLDNRHIGRAIDYGAQILEQLAKFHAKGLWHKDIKPSNILVAEDRVHLVDLGLVTPLASAMTLTTHGTEYFRDPEMVRLAMQGVKVHEVDGVKFDLYSAGAVIYALFENSFPAHGSLSQISKRCPDTLTWIVRRAMADMPKRYASANEMLRDLRALAFCDDPFAARPADLPSFGAPSSAPEGPERGADPFARAARFAGRLTGLGAASTPRAAWRADESDRRAASGEPPFQGDPRALDPATLASRALRGVKRAFEPRAFALGSDAQPSVPDPSPEGLKTRSAPSASRRESRLQARRSKRIARTAARAEDPERRRRRRVGRGFAVIGFLVVASAVGSELVDKAQRRRMHWTSGAGSVHAQSAATLVNDVTRVFASHALAAHPSVPARGDHGTLWLAPSLPANPGVLVLCEDGEIPAELLQRVRDALELQDYRVLGLSDRGLGATAALDDELVSDALYAVALHDLSDPRAAEALEELVRARSELEYVLWLEQGSDGPRALAVGRGLQHSVGVHADPFPTSARAVTIGVPPRPGAGDEALEPVGAGASPAWRIVF